MSHPISKPRKPEILISGGLVVGGPQTHVTILCKCLLAAGANVTIAAAATNMKSAEIAVLQALGIRILIPRFGFGRMKCLGTLQCLLTWPLLLLRRYDTLYCLGHGRMHLFTARFIRPSGRKIYHEIVGCPKPGSHAAAAAARMTHLVGNSRLVSSQMRDLFPSIPVTTIPFLTSEAPAPAPAARSIPPGHTLRLAFLGRVVHHKRPDVLVREWTNLLKLPGLAPARLDIHGGDYGNGMIAALRATVRELDLADQVGIHGSYDVTALPGILANTDLVVLPSEFEGLPLVLVEAMQRGIPIIATSAGGCEELGDGNPDAIITPGNSWENFIEGLAEITTRIRAGDISPSTLHKWTEKRYGFAIVSGAWTSLLNGAQNTDNPPAV